MSDEMSDEESDGVNSDTSEEWEPCVSTSVAAIDVLADRDDIGLDNNIVADVDYDIYSGDHNGSTIFIIVAKIDSRFDHGMRRCNITNDNPQDLLDEFHHLWLGFDTGNDIDDYETNLYLVVNPHHIRMRERQLIALNMNDDVEVFPTNQNMYAQRDESPANATGTLGVKLSRSLIESKFLDP